MSNNDIKFIDTSKEVKSTMEKLSKSALRAAGRVVSKALKENTRYRTNNLKNHIGFWAKINRDTGQPELQVGYYSWQRVKKKGKQPSHANPMWFEFGVTPHVISIHKARNLSNGKIAFGKSVKHPGLRDEHILRNSVINNIEEIKKAEQKYLSELNKTIEDTSGKVVESEEIEDA